MFIDSVAKKRLLFFFKYCMPHICSIHGISRIQRDEKAVKPWVKVVYNESLLHSKFYISDVIFIIY